ncbi:hypothetical protein IEE94_11165 [Yimella sp. cx-573]|nr:hypothetical protein [Yimella sp. cx-573]
MSEQTTTAPATDPAAQQPAAPTPSPADVAPKQPEQQPAQQQTTTEGRVEDLPDWAQKMIRDARGEAAKDRTNAKQAAADEARTEYAQAIGKALGLITDDTAEQVDPAKLTADLTAAQQQQRDAAVELAIYKAATATGADPAKLTDSRAFMASIPHDLDPTDTTAVTELVSAAVDKNPSLRTLTATGASSANHTGGSGEGAITREQFNAMTGAERNELAQTNRPLYDQLTGRS